MRHTTTTDSSIEAGDLVKLLGGAAAGALLMYMLDPDRGSARRATSTSALRNAGTRTGSALGNAWHGIGERIGKAARQAGDAASEMLEDASDTAGKYVDEASSRASKYADEAGSRANRMLESAKPNGSARRSYEDAVDGASRMLDDASSSASAAASRFGRMASNAAGSAARALHLENRDDLSALLRNPAVVGGGVLGLIGLFRRSPVGAAVALGALALAARSSGGGGSALAKLLGSGRGRSIDLEKSIRIDASPDEVYDMWSNYENFPRFMSHVVDVRDMGRRRSHWVVQGPAGTQFEFDSVLTEQTKNRRLAWRSEPGAQIPNAGSVEFEPYRGGTRVTVRLSYSPPAGAIGHGLASLFGSDPKGQMDDDLARMKQYIERGKIPHDAAQREKSGSRFLH
ncbi:SRPBCC family protein [Massilia litorea]|uniref:SRPBCC family protein n=1 Tax=Massilia litorea TaxID=2769491 RepID=A0A7L9U026_9BURK|nr:SRPBCC family protein [Massilia litorea]QOL48290.1 SRPBCC family protein [Massilia litorea]